MREDIYWIYLQNIIGYGSRKLLKILDIFETAENFYNASYEAKVKSKLFVKSEIDKIDNYDIKSAYKVIEKCDKLGYKIITPDNPSYPMRLKHIVNPPAVLYVQGTLPDIDDEVMLAVVGTRKASDYSRALTRELSERLTKAGAYIVSGGALGIDTSAHTGALAAKGNTIAVLACGLNYNYLAANEPLRMDIAANGALISEFPPDFPVYPSNFHIRNRILSGLCLGTVVIEAGRKSGALITVDHALEQGRDIFVIPGDISSERYVGSNRLIRDGAKIVTSPMDILEEYTHIYPHRINIAGCGEMLKGNTDEIPVSVMEYEKVDSAENKPSVKPPKKKPSHDNERQMQNNASDNKPESFIPDKSVVNLSDDAMELYLAFSKTVMLFDELVEESGLSVTKALAAATELEISGVAEALPGGRYQICKQSII